MIDGTAFQASPTAEDSFLCKLMASNATEVYKNIPTIVIRGHSVEGIYGQKTPLQEGRTWLYLTHLELLTQT